MNLTRKAYFIVAFFTTIISSQSFAQYKHQIDPFWSNFGNGGRRYEIGGGLVMASGVTTGVTTVLGAGNYYRGDSTITRNISGQGFGGSIGLNLPFRATGHISCWAATIQLMGNMVTWTQLNQTMSTSGTFSDASKKLEASMLQVGLPIGIDYKIGHDAILTKRLPFGASMGAGIFPQFNMTNLPAISGYTAQQGYSIWPYAKVDLSAFTGFCWKIRIMYTMGNVNLLDVNRKLPGYNDGPFNIASNSQLMASLIIMPFSGKWREFAWYNTYDTYNTHDRFN